MYSRRVHSALGRSRPLGNDISRFTDGVIASMRQLHVSAILNQEEDAVEVTSASTPNRTERSKEAASEITSLPSSQPSRGIDARSLAAQPPPSATFRITRVDPRIGRGGGGQGGRFGNPQGGDRPSFGGVRREGTAVRAGLVGGARGGLRGNLRGRGAGRGARGGRGRGPRKPRAPRAPKAEDEEGGVRQTFYNPEEWKFHCALEFGVHTPAVVGQTSIESLQELAPSWPVTPTGIKNTVKSHMEAVAGGRKLETADQIKQRLEENKYVSFRNDQEKKEIRKELYPSGSRFKPLEYEGGKNEIMRQLVGGEYQAVEAGPVSDPLGVIKTYTLKNESYLPGDAKELMGKVRRLLPVEETEAQPEKGARTS